MMVEPISQFAEIKDILSIVGVIVAVAGFVWAVVVYRNNSKLERAKWALTLYEKFFELPDLKEIRDILDCDVDNENVNSLVLGAGSKFTDYLNFFEAVRFF